MANLNIEPNEGLEQLVSKKNAVYVIWKHFSLLEMTLNKRKSNVNTAEKLFQQPKVIPPICFITWITSYYCIWTVHGSVQIIAHLFIFRLNYIDLRSYRRALLLPTVLKAPATNTSTRQLRTIGYTAHQSCDCVLMLKANLLHNVKQNFFTLARWSGLFTSTISCVNVMGDWCLFPLHLNCQDMGSYIGTGTSEIFPWIGFQIGFPFSFLLHILLVKYLSV